MKTYDQIKQLINESIDTYDMYYMDSEKFIDCICIMDKNVLVLFMEKLPSDKIDIIDKIMKNSNAKIGKKIDDPEKVDKILEKNPITDKMVIYLNPKYFDKESIEKINKSGLNK